MTPQVLDFISKTPLSKRVLEVGAYDVNGSARNVVKHMEWVGTDMREGPQVDVVIDATKLHEKFEPESFDCVICAETLEHCEDWRAVVSEMWATLKVGGYLAITAPAPGFPKHDFPNDYQRFQPIHWLLMFKNQEVLHCEMWYRQGPTSGVIVRKVTNLVDLSQIVPPPVTSKIVIATPFYERKGFSPYITSLVETLRLLTKLNIEYDYLELSGDSYVDRAKNTIATLFLESDATDLIMIDSDLGWDPKGLLKLLEVPVDLVGGVYPMKVGKDKFPCRVYQNDDGSVKMDMKTGLIEAEFLPGGFTRYSRGCLMQMAELLYDKRYQDPSAAPDKPNQWFYPFFECPVQDRKRYGEDVWFQKNWRSLGQKVWACPDIDFGHYGSEGWQGNFHKYLVGAQQ